MKYRSLYSVVLSTTLLLTPFASLHAGLLLGKYDREHMTTHTGSPQGDRTTSGPWLMTYYVGYQNSYLKPRDVDYSLMTHIVVGGVGVNADGSLNEHWHLTEGDGREMAREVGARADRERVKKLVWLGGPNEESKLYAATSDQVRPTTVRNILALVRELDYDGVDIDWEPIRRQDEARVLALVRDLRAAESDLLITIPVNWVPTTILATKDLSIYPKLARYVDRLFIMSYSMAGPWPGWRSWYSGALTGDTLSTPGSVRTSVRAYERAGVPNGMLGVGIGTYATCWEYPVREPNQAIPSTFALADVHTMSMRTLMDGYYVRKYERWDSRAEVPYLTLPVPMGDLHCGFISYENERSVEEKVTYTHTHGLGGILVWNIGTGYYPDAGYGERHPLLKAASDALE